MKIIFRPLFAAIVACAAICTLPAATPSVYPVPPIYAQTLSPYTLTANGVTIPVVGYVEEYDYAQFSIADGPVTLEVTVSPHQAIVSHGISPKKLALSGDVKGNTLTFRLDRPEYLIVRINQLKRLVIAVDPPETDVPVPGAGTFDVTGVGYNVDSTGQHLATVGIQRAIDAASDYGAAHGQGTVYLPAGVYRSGNLQLKSHVTLYLAPGAVLRASDNPQDFTPHYYKTSQRRYVTWFLSTQPGAENVGIRGRGTIDANGLHLGERMGLGTNFLVPLSCRSFAVDGVTFRDSSAWGIVTARSQDLRFTNLKIFNRLSQTGENDGIDICESQDVRVSNVIGISLDDPFSTKTWGVNTGLSQRWPGEPQPNRNIIFDRCISWTHCYGFKVGQGARLPQEDIVFRNGVVYDCAAAIGIDHKYGTAPVSRVIFENIDIEEIEHFNEGHSSWITFLIQNSLRDGAGPISDVIVRNINVRALGYSGGFLTGHGGLSTIRGITFENITVPGLDAPAATLDEMNITHASGYTDLKIISGR